MNDIIFDGLIVACVFILGVGSSQLYVYFNPKSECLTQAKIRGVWLPDVKALSNYSGRFICINIDETKSLTDLAWTCQHEVGHEIFAMQCANNFTKCLEIGEK